ncbi:MAG: hypothetical protein ACI9DQ_000163 [Glaciecola sp.]|jgi:hypothetical protein
MSALMQVDFLLKIYLASSHTIEIFKIEQMPMDYKQLGNTARLV